MGNHHAWDRCTSPTPCKTTSVGGETKLMPQENNGKAVTQWPTSKASLGWINGKLWLLPWTSTGASTEDGWGPQVMQCGCRPWKEYICKVEGTTSMPIDAGGLWTPWQIWPLMELGHSRQGQTKRGGVKQVSTPMSGGMTMLVYLSDAEYSHPPEEGSLPPVEGWLHTLHWRWAKTKTSQETRIDSQSMRMCSLKKKGGSKINPLGVTQAMALNSLWISPPTKLWTVIDSIVSNKGLQ